MRWESECFFRTYKRVVKDVRLVSRTVPMVVREAEISLLACQLLLGQGALALKVGGKRAGRDELKCSAAEVLREIRREPRRGSQAGAAAQFCQAVATDRTRSTGANRSQDEERTTAAEEACGSPAAAVEGSQCRAKAPDRSFKPQGSGGLSYYANMRYLKSRWNPDRRWVPPQLPDSSPGRGRGEPRLAGGRAPAAPGASARRHRRRSRHGRGTDSNPAHRPGGCGGGGAEQPGGDRPPDGLAEIARHLTATEGRDGVGGGRADSTGRTGGWRRKPW